MNEDFDEKNLSETNENNDNIEATVQPDDFGINTNTFDIQQDIAESSDAEIAAAEEQLTETDLTSDPELGDIGSFTNEPSQPQFYTEPAPAINAKPEKIKKERKPKKEKAPLNRTVVAVAIISAVALILSVVFAAMIPSAIKALSEIEKNKRNGEVTTGTANPYTDPTAKLSYADSTSSSTSSDTSSSGENTQSDPVSSGKSGYSYIEVAEKTVNSVVEIRTEQMVQGVFMQQYITSGAGSGVIVTENGYIATNNHVVDGATTITVILRDGTEYEANLVGKDAVADIAVVKINATGLQYATFGSSDKLKVAQSVIAIGNPLGELGGSVTEGIISALARTVTIENQEMTLLQTTAAINPGNSGGGLFDMNGHCIGIVNAKSSGTGIEGIGFAIPSDVAVPVIQDIIKDGYAHGRVMLGISMAEITDRYTAALYRLSDLGVYVSEVTKDSDADKAGIQPKDLIYSVDGTLIESAAQLKKIIQSHSVGDVFEIVVKRNGEMITLNVELTEYKPE